MYFVYKLDDGDLLGFSNKKELEKELTELEEFGEEYEVFQGKKLEVKRNIKVEVKE